MTTSVRAGGIHGASVTQRALPAAPARSQEWQTLYQRQLAQEGQDQSSEGLRDAHVRASASQSGAPKEDHRSPDPSRVAVVAMAEHSVSSRLPMLLPLIGSEAAGSPKTEEHTPAPDGRQLPMEPAGLPALPSWPTHGEKRGGVLASQPFAPAAGPSAGEPSHFAIPPSWSAPGDVSGLSGPHGAHRGVRSAQTGVSTPQAAPPVDRNAEPNPSQITVVAVGGQPASRIVDGDNAVKGPELDAGSIATAASVLMPQRKALPELTPARSATPPSDKEERQPTAAVAQTPTAHSRPESQKNLARALAAPAALALPAAVLVQAGRAPASRHASRRLPSSETPVDAVAASAITPQRADAAAGAGAGTTQQRGGDSARRQRSERDAFSTGSGSGRHYGTFPLIVSGELLELEFVALRSGRNPGAGTAVSRIFVSVQPPGMGRLQLTAQNLGDRVTVSFGGQSAQGAAVPALDVSALLRRLGWGAYPVKVDGAIP